MLGLKKYLNGGKRLFLSSSETNDIIQQEGIITAFKGRRYLTSSWLWAWLFCCRGAAEGLGGPALVGLIQDWESREAAAMVAVVVMVTWMSWSRWINLMRALRRSSDA